MVRHEGRRVHGVKRVGRLQSRARVAADRLGVGRIIAAFSLALLPLVFLDAGAFAETTPAAAIEAAKAELRDPSYQSSFPGETPSPQEQGEKSRDSDDDPVEPAPEAPTPAPEVPDSSSPPEPPSPSLGDGSGGLDFGNPLLIIAIVGLVVVLLYLLTRLKTPPAEAAAPKVPAIVVARVTATDTMAPALPPSPIEEAERLAALGRYTEAIHAILLRLLHDLRHAGGPAPSASTTSREILRQASLPERFRDGLSVLVGAVELCHFGGRAADQRLFEHCAAAYHTATARDDSLAKPVRA